TCGGIRKGRGQEIFRLHALELRWQPAPVTTPRDRKRDGRVPPPMGTEHRRVEQRLNQDVFHRFRLKEAEDVFEGEGMLGAEREENRLVGCRRLQLEVELPAEAFPEREAPRSIHPAAERRVDDELHATRLVEEALGDDRVLRRERAEHAL